MKLLRSLFSAIICLALITAGTTNISAAEHKVIGIADFETKLSADTTLAPMITNLLTQEVVKNRSYKLVAQQTLSQKLSRLGISSGLYERLDSLEAEQFAGIHFLLAGEIKEAEVKTVQLNGFQQLRAKVLVNVRMAHIPAQQIIYAEAVVGEASQTFLLERQEEADSAVRAALLETAAKRVVSQIAAKVNSINPMSGIVLSVNQTDGSIIIDMGSEHRVSAGQLYQIYKDGSVLLHPATNLEFGRAKQEIAVVRVEKANQLESVAKLVSGKISEVHPGLKAIIKQHQ